MKKSVNFRAFPEITVTKTRAEDCSIHSVEPTQSDEEVVRPEGVEPPAYRFEACRSIQLSYGRAPRGTSFWHSAAKYEPPSCGGPRDRGRRHHCGSGPPDPDDMKPDDMKGEMKNVMRDRRRLPALGPGNKSGRVQSPVDVLISGFVSGR